MGAWIFRGLLAVAICYFLFEGRKFSPGAARLPQLVAGFTLAFLLIDTITTWFAGRRGRAASAAPGGRPPAGSLWESPRFYATAFWLLAFCFLFPWLGYLPSSMLFVFGLSWMLGERRWYVLALCSLAVPLLFWYASEEYLKVAMPKGAWLESFFE